MSQKVKQKDDLEGLLVSILGIAIVLGVTALIYFGAAYAIPNNSGASDMPNDPITKWIWLALGGGFFLYGVVGAIREKIGVGWGTGYNQVSTVLEGTSAIVSGVGTTIGGLLMLATTGIIFYPSLSAIFHPFASLICGFVAVILGWVSGLIIRALGY
jgi:hypothetical protein